MNIAIEIAGCGADPSISHGEQCQMRPADRPAVVAPAAFVFDPVAEIRAVRLSRSDTA